MDVKRCKGFSAFPLGQKQFSSPAKSSFGFMNLYDVSPHVVGAIKSSRARNNLYMLKFLITSCIHKQREASAKIALTFPAKKII